MTMKKGRKSNSLVAAGKGTELLEMLAAGARELSVSALARKVGLSRYQTLRLLSTLQGRGADCAEAPCRYAGSCPSLVLGQKLSESSALLEHAHPVLESLATLHNEAVYMTVLKGDEVLFLDMVDSRWQVKAEPFVGRRFPFFSNAAGKVMRAIDSWDLMEKIGRRWRGGLVQFPDLAGFRVELEQIREKGVAIDCGGMGEGIVTVAVAIRDYAGKVVGALMMAAPAFRLIGDRLENEIVPSLMLSGEMLSMKFGYARP
jgi:IclR family transcriptional regulator, KDG regulon repressor